LANEFNARRLPVVERLKSRWWEWNPFFGLKGSPVFLLIVFVTFVLQVIFVQLGGEVFRCSPLSAVQWLFCVGLGLLELPVQFLINGVILLIDHLSGSGKTSNEFEFEAEDHIDPDKEQGLIGNGIINTGFEIDLITGERIERPDKDIIPWNKLRIRSAQMYISSKRVSRIEEEKVQHLGRQFLSRSHNLDHFVVPDVKDEIFRLESFRKWKSANDLI